MKLIKIIFSLKTKALSRLFCLSTLFAILFVLAGFGYQQLSDQKVALASSVNEAELFKSKCGKCHDPEVALQDYRSAEVWRETIARMKEEHSAEISQEEADLLVKYHVGRQKQESSIFKETCEKCHPGKVFVEKSLKADQTRAIIKRMQQKAGNSIEDKDIETIVRYHARAHQAALKESIKKFEETRTGQPGQKKEVGLQEGMALFVEKCSECHELNRALTVFRDPEVWDQTIKRMQSYSKGGISDQQAEELVGFHVTEQQREIHAFKETCTQCHDDQRINSRSMSDDQWLATIKRMQKKAPELISDEKINLLAAYFHRRELSMARIFSGKCQICHNSTDGEAPFQGSRTQLGGVIVLASEEFGESFQITDVDGLVAFHAQRQDRNMNFYRSNCKTCHLNGPPRKKRRGQAQAGKEERSRAEWISFIAVLQGEELNMEIQNTINSQIDYHIANQ